MEVDAPQQGTSSAAVSLQDALAAPERRRRQLELARARQQRDRLLDERAGRADLPKVVLPADWNRADDAGAPSRLLLEEAELHDMRINAAEVVRADLASRGLPFLERADVPEAPFLDITRILAETLATVAAAKLQQQQQQAEEAELAPAVSVAPSASQKPATRKRAPAPLPPGADLEVTQIGLPASLQPAPEPVPIAPLLRQGRLDGGLVHPQLIDGFKVYAFGRFTDARAEAFVQHGVLLVPGYKVARPFLSTTQGAPNVVTHVCEVLNRNGAPVCRIFCEDSQETIEDASLAAAWAVVGRRAFELRGYQCNDTLEAASDFFGLSVPRVRSVLQERALEAGLPLERLGFGVRAYIETPSVADDPDFALRTVETSLVRVPSTQAIETVVPPSTSPRQSFHSPSPSASGLPPYARRTSADEVYGRRTSHSSAASSSHVPRPPAGAVSPQPMAPYGASGSGSPSYSTLPPDAQSASLGLPALPPTTG